MAVCIVSDLAKDMAGDPLFTSVSFKLERRDRMTLSGRNGAGQAPPCRTPAGEASHDGGEVVFAKGTKVSLHDQRPPRERDVSLRDYVLSGAKELVALEEELARLEDAMAAGDHAEATLNRYAEGQARLEHAGGYTWRGRALPRASGTRAATRGGTGHSRRFTASGSPTTTSTGSSRRSPGASSRAPRWPAPSPA